MSNSVRLQAILDQAAARVSELCSECDIDLHNPMLQKAMHLLMLDISMASKEIENTRAMVLVACDAWLEAMKPPLAGLA